VNYTPILAHFGHWYISLPTFMAPVLLIVIGLKVSAWRERRRLRAGDTSRLRVRVISTGDRETLTVSGPLDYPTVLEIEQKLGAAVRRAPEVLLDLSLVTSVAEELAWRIAEIIGEHDREGSVSVLIGSAPELEPLKKICAIEGVKMLSGDASQPSDPAGA
jgi:ABC-type transporter Mla MlaB component